VLFILGNINQYLWVLTHISFILVFMVFLNYVIPKIKNNTRKALIFTGKISMAIFLVNGFLRFPMARWAIAYDNWLMTVGLCLVFLVITYMVALVLHKTEQEIFRRLKNYKLKKASQTFT
jgi:peptidoglycan/LPS O-acetylase OafA/YrhL